MFNYIKIPNYFFEIKVRATYSIFFFVFILISSFTYKETLLYILTKECFIKNDRLTPYFIYTNLTEVFYAYLEICLLIGFYLTIPYTVAQLWLFLKPGLYKIEYKKIKNYVLVYLGIYVVTTFVTHYAFLPFMWYFFLGFESISSNNSIDIFFEAKLDEYIKFIYQLYFVIGFYSQFCFMLIIYLLYSFHTNLKLVKQSRSFVYFSIFIFASLVTPPDVTSQLAIAIPFLVCYEIMLLFFITLEEYLIYSKKSNIEKNGI